MWWVPHKIVRHHHKIGLNVVEHRKYRVHMWLEQPENRVKMWWKHQKTGLKCGENATNTGLKCGGITQNRI